ncbi:class I SAM-dependent methyltransferase [Streptomyces sp. NPDC005811]|uniref:class I SAM-dependent methyltransferase n=1 Tax=Streptomyces sp. NPDC005811 TaxID=3154565 RepID=UPI0033C78E59
MSSYVPSELFASTAPFYHYRPGYAPELYEQLRGLLGLDGTQRVLDLGTGPGVLALPLSRMVREVVAVDPAPGMLEEARKTAAAQGVANVRWVLGDSTQLMRLDIGVVTLAVMGAAFHWTDRDQVLRDLDRLVVAEGAVALASGGAPGSVEPPEWNDVITAVRTKYLVSERRAGSGTYRHPKGSHQEVLARSPFSNVQSYRWDLTVPSTLDQLVLRQYSFSYSSPA